MTGEQSLIIILTVLLSLTYSSFSVDLQVEVVSSKESLKSNGTSVVVHPAVQSSSHWKPQYQFTHELFALTKGAIASRTDWLWRQAEKWNKLTKFFAEFDLRSYLGLKGGSKDGLLSIQASIIEGHKLQFTITNNYRKALCVQKIGLLLENRFWPVGVKVWQGDKQLPQASFNIPLFFKKINEKNFLLLNSGESATVTRDLTDYFKLVSKTQYSVELISYLTYYKRNGETEGCRHRDTSPIENAQVHKWKSSPFQLDTKFTPVWKRHLSLSGWLKEKHDVITKASNKVYVASRKKVDKNALVYVLQVHKLTVETLKGAIDVLRKIQSTGERKKSCPYKRWFGELDEDSISQLIKTYSKILHGLNKDPLIFSVCTPCYVFQPLFAIPFHTMSNKGIPLLNLCSGPLYYKHHLVIEAVFDTIRGLSQLYTGASHTYKPLLSQEDGNKGEINLRNKVLPLVEHSHEKAIKSGENLAIFAMEVVDVRFVLEKEHSTFSKVRNVVRKKIRKGKKSLRNILKKLRQKFTRG